MDIEDIAKKITSADWYYNYADDYGAYSRGSGQVKEITNICKSVDWNDESRLDLMNTVFSIINTRYVNSDMTDSVKEYWENKVNFLTRNEDSNA